MKVISEDSWSTTEYMFTKASIDAVQRFAYRLMVDPRGFHLSLAKFSEKNFSEIYKFRNQTAIINKINKTIWEPQEKKQ